MIRALFVLGRVSNLPTVFSNVLAGIYLAGGNPLSVPEIMIVLLGAISFFYVGGMYLNDAYDARWDRKNRPDRPIPAEKIKRGTVFFLGYAFLGAGVGTLFAYSNNLAGTVGIGLALTITLYDLLHKRVAGTSILMGISRALVYVLAFSAIRPDDMGNAYEISYSSFLFFYVVGLTEAARSEHLSRLAGLPLLFLAFPLFLVFPGLLPSLPTPSPLFILFYGSWVGIALYLISAKKIYPAVGMLIAGIAILDAVFISAYSLPGALVAIGLAALTLVLQRIVPGT